jgi:hypothetical protein
MYRCRPQRELHELPGVIHPWPIDIARFAPAASNGGDDG